jgi:predicted membrane protein
MCKSVVRRILFGILFVALGIAIIGDVAGVWDLSKYSNGWWALFIVVPGLAGIISSGFEFWNVGLVVIGCWLYGDANNFFGDKGLSWLWLLGIMLVVLGIRVIFGSSHHKYKKIPIDVFDDRKFSESAEDYPEYSCVFSSQNITNKSQTLSGGKASAIFGKMVLDLRDVSIKNNITFEVNSVFGNLDVIVPKNVPVRLVFGNYHNFAANNNFDKNAARIDLKGAAVFGQINIY